MRSIRAGSSLLSRKSGRAEEFGVGGGGLVDSVVFFVGVELRYRDMFYLIMAFGKV